MKTVLNFKGINLEIEVRDWNNKEHELSICAEYNGSGGQCLDSIKEDINELNFTDMEKQEVLNIISIWEEYHLKDISSEVLESLNISISKLQHIIAEYDEKDNTKVIEEIEEYLKDNFETTVSIIRDINSWDGSLEDYRLEENDHYFFENYFGDNPYGAVKAIADNNDYNIDDEYVTTDIYGTVTSYSEIEYKRLISDYIDEIAECLIENLAHVELNDELKEIINKLYV